MKSNPTLIALLLALTFGFVGLVSAANNNAFAKCTETQSPDTCHHTLK